MALYVRKTILEFSAFDCFSVTNLINYQLDNLNNNKEINFEGWILQIPVSLIELASFYALTFCIDEIPHVGRRTNNRKLRNIEEVGIDFCNRIIRYLQKYYSNLVAMSYYNYLDPMRKKIKISGLPVEMWGNYVQPTLLRKDQNDVMYAPCLYSMQVSLAHLMYSQAKIAIISDVMQEKKRVQRYVKIFQGDGKAKFNLIASEQENMNEVVIVFGGCSYNEGAIEELMEPWLSHLPSLVLACDLYYPQFPKLSNDLKFDSSSINPEEELIKQVIDQHSSIKGVCAKNPHLFCLTHIYPASLKSILKVINGEEDALPNFFVPFQIALESNN